MTEIEENLGLESKLNIVVTEDASEHFLNLLDNEDEGTNLRIFVVNNGTLRAEVGLTYCPLGSEEEGDIPLLQKGYILYVASDSKDALTDANIDYKDADTGGELSIKAPHLKGKKPDIGSPLNERIQYILDIEINPNLANHGGKVSLVDVDTTTGVVSLRFGGGCQGCGMADVTLKNGIESKLKEEFPEIKEIRDITDHTVGENPYY